jgi:hypothetical protein
MIDEGRLEPFVLSGEGGANYARPFASIALVRSILDYFAMTKWPRRFHFQADSSWPWTKGRSSP